MNMEGMSIFTIRKGTFREDSVAIALLIKKMPSHQSSHLSDVRNIYFSDHGAAKVHFQ